MSETTTPKQEVAKPLDIARTFLTDPALQAQLKIAAGKFSTPERLARIALTAVLKTPKLGECFLTPQGKASIAKSLLTATQRGLEVDGRQGHLVPFRCKLPGGGSAMQAEFIPGYMGLTDLAYRHPLVGAIWAEVVYEKDEFIHEKGLNRVLVHRPYEGDDDPGPLRYAYAVCEMKNGNKTFVVMNRRDIQRIRASSRGAAEPDSIWNKHPDAMWKKSAIRQLCKFIPQSTELRDVLDHDDRVTEAQEPIETMKRAKVPDPLSLPESTTEALPESTESEPVTEQAEKPAKKEKKAPAQPAKTEQEQLCDFVVTDCKSNWARFYEVCVAQGWMSDSADVNGFDELEAAFCISRLAEKAVLKTVLASNG